MNIFLPSSQVCKGMNEGGVALNDRCDFDTAGHLHDTISPTSIHSMEGQAL